MKKLLLSVLILITGSLNVYAGWDSNLYGKVEGDVYMSSPRGFKVPIPVEKHEGGLIQDNISINSTVIFTDDFGSLYRIDCIDAEENELQKMGKEKYLQAVLKEFYLPEMILPASPLSEIIEEYYSPDLFNGAYSCVVNMPKGSTLAASTDGKNYEGFDVRRGLLVFVNKTQLFIVSYSFSNISKVKSREEEIKRIKDQLVGFAKTIIFD